MNEELIQQVLEKTEQSHYFDSIKAAIASKRKCIYFMTTEKAGKSALINALLEQISVPQSQQLKTARFTRVTYSEIAFVAVINQDGQIDKFYLANRVNEEDVMETSFLHETSYLKTLKSCVIIGLPNMILQNGFDFMDTPIYNVCVKANEYIINKVFEDRPLVVLLLEGATLTVSTVELAGEMMAAGLKIMFYSSKLARANISDYNYNDPDLVPKRLKSAYNRLVKNNLLSGRSPMLETNQFFGSDVWKINDVYLHQTLKEEDIHPLLVLQWKRFKLSIQYSNIIYQ